MSQFKRDHALAAFKATVNLVPLVGGSVASLIDDYVPTSKQKAIDQGWQLFSARIESLETRINSESANKEDFAELFQRFEDVISRTNRREKLEAAANILTNVLLKPNDPAKSPFEELDHLMHCVDKLSSGAITILGAVRTLPPQGQLGIHSFSAVWRQLPQIEQSLLMSLLMELHSLNLVRVTEGAVGTPDWQHVSVQLTLVGQRFAERFIEGRL